MVPKHKNYDPKLPQDQAENLKFPKKHAKKRVKTGSKPATNQTKKLRKFRNETEIKLRNKNYEEQNKIQTQQKINFETQK